MTLTTTMQLQRQTAATTSCYDDHGHHHDYHYGGDDSDDIGTAAATATATATVTMTTTTTTTTTYHCIVELSRVLGLFQLFLLYSMLLWPLAVELVCIESRVRDHSATVQLWTLVQGELLGICLSDARSSPGHFSIIERCLGDGGFGLCSITVGPTACHAFRREGSMPVPWQVRRPTVLTSLI